MSRGFLLGKFLPPHAGHRFLCETALGLVDELAVLVCSLASDPIPGEERANWMVTIVPKARILRLESPIPQYPEEHPEFWTIWPQAVRELHPDPIDRVFASEIYVFALAEALGAEPVLVDPEREAFPVCGSRILADPAAHWRFIPPAVRGWFQKRVCLLGPESVGKSTLAAALADRFGTIAMPEYGRAYDVHYKQAHHAQGDQWSAGDLLALARTHAAMRAALAPSAGPLVIEDTDAIQTAVWAEYLIGTAPAELEALAASAAADFYLLLAPDIEWIADGARYAGDPRTRRRFFESARSRLEALGLPYKIVAGGDWEGRKAAAIRFVVERFGDLRPDAAPAQSSR